MTARHGHRRCARVPIWRRRVVPLLAVLTLLALLAGCEDILVDGPLQEQGNVRAEIGVAVVESDSGTVVNGRQVMSYPPKSRALWLDRFERFDLGGFPELDYAQDARHSESWRVMLTHAHPPEQRGDSTIFRYHDHGQVSLAGVPMEKLTDLPDLGPSAPSIRFENFIRYLLSTAVDVEWMDGRTTHFVRLPFHDDLVAGRDVALESTGSDDALPVQATFTAVALARLTAVENAGVVDLRSGGVPVVYVDQPLVLEFDAALDPQHAYMILHPMGSHAQPGARAFIQTRSPTSRVVIPPELLRALVAQATTPIAYRATIVEVRVQEDVLTGQLAHDEPDQSGFALPFVQRGETSVHLYLGKR